MKIDFEFDDKTSVEVAAKCNAGKRRNDPQVIRVGVDQGMFSSDTASVRFVTYISGEEGD